VRERILATLAVLAATYEWIAVHWKPWPTFTAIIRPHRDVAWTFWVGCLSIQLIALLAMVHLFGIEAAGQPQPEGGTT
jgi:hypothetical protein